MCITGLAINAHPQYRLVLVFNRDESLTRPTSPLNFWRDQTQEIYAGKDQVGGGTWLAISRNGRIAILTNYWDEQVDKEYNSVGSSAINSNKQGGFLTRGFILISLVTDERNVETILNEMYSQRTRFKPFNVIAGEVFGDILHFSHNISGMFKGVKKLQSGIYSLSNIEMNGKWKILHDIRDRLGDIVNRGNEIEIEELFEIMECDQISQFEDEEQEEKTSIFAQHFTKERNGIQYVKTTVSTTVILIQHDGEATVVERTWNPEPSDEVHFFRIPL